MRTLGAPLCRAARAAGAAGPCGLLLRSGIEVGQSPLGGRDDAASGGGVSVASLLAKTFVLGAEPAG